MPETAKHMGLTQVYPAKEPQEARAKDEKVCAGIDIISIHGLNTKSPDTWIWKDRKDPTRSVNWLKDRDILPSTVGSARVFTCDWPADMDMAQTSVGTTVQESAQHLLVSIRGHLRKSTKPGKTRRIFFIASCLGGIILIKTLEMDRLEGKKGDSPSVIEATRGIVFLATPFLGTSFKYMPSATLKIWGLLRDQTATALMDYTREPSPNADEVLRNFMQLQQEKRYHVFTFWEAEKTSLLKQFHLAWMFPSRGHLVWPTRSGPMKPSRLL